MIFNFPVLDVFLEEILKDKDYFQPDNEIIIKFCHLLDAQERQYHVEGKVIWKKRAWIENDERKAKLRMTLKLDKERVDANKQALAVLREQIEDMWGISDESTRLTIALKILKDRNLAAATVLGIDLSNIPKLDKPYSVIEKINGKDIVYEL